MNPWGGRNNLRSTYPFPLIRDAYLDANPGNSYLRGWLDDALEQFDKVYKKDRPGFIEGYATLKQTITPWGA